MDQKKKKKRKRKKWWRGGFSSQWNSCGGDDKPHSQSLWSCAAQRVITGRASSIPPTWCSHSHIYAHMVDVRLFGWKCNMISSILAGSLISWHSLRGIVLCRSGKQEERCIAAPCDRENGSSYKHRGGIFSCYINTGRRWQEVASLWTRAMPIFLS